MDTDAGLLPSPESLREALRAVIDPEAGMNIVDLGLVYDVAVSADGVRVVMTTTSPACPVGELVADEVRALRQGAAIANGIALLLFVLTLLSRVLSGAVKREAVP